MSVYHVLLPSGSLRIRPHPEIGDCSFPRETSSNTFILVDGQAFTGDTWGFTSGEWETIPHSCASRSWVLDLEGLGSKGLSLRWGGEGTPSTGAREHLYSKRTQVQAKTGALNSLTRLTRGLFTFPVHSLICFVILKVSGYIHLQLKV